ncbi:MAG TPA: putative LPS assembly protein LptD [Longimicrobiales bacterium]|nr:putative LPS assembly protein LptD [Longimicrobiales bacterium]
MSFPMNERRGSPARSGLLALALILVGGAAAAQQPVPAAKPEPPKDPRTRILDRLKTLDAKAAPPDATAVSQDSTAQVVVTPDAIAPPAGAPGVRPPARQTTVTVTQDSVMKALSELPGFTATSYEGSSARFLADTGQLVLKGPAKVVQAGEAMTADSMLVYDQVAAVACGYGKPVLAGTGENAPVESDQICFDVRTKMGVALGARTKFTEQGTWFVHGEKVYTAGSERLFAHDAEFTDCDLKVPHYHFTAKKVKIVKGDVLVARDVTLNFGDVPVFWLPFMMQSMKQGRRSGLLPPRFDINDIARTSPGYNRRIQDVGFYLAISDNLGAEASMDWFSNNYTALNGSFDYNFARQFLQGAVTAKQYWKQGGGTELTLASQNSWRPDERTNVSLSASYATSSAFVRRQSFDPRELNRTIDSNGALGHNFSWGSLNLQASRRQYITDSKVEWQLPAVGLNIQPISLFGAGTWSGGVNVDTRRVDIKDFTLSPTSQESRGVTGSMNSSFNLGRLSWSQSLSYGRSDLLARDSVMADDTTKVVEFAPGKLDNKVDWSSSLSFQQRLIGTSSFTPHLALRGQTLMGGQTITVRDSTTGKDSTFALVSSVSAPMRLDFGADLQTDLYGFWPGVGPFAAIRHKFSPGIGYSYSPTPTSVSDRQKQAFGGLEALRETNQLTFRLNQTFEAKFKGTQPNPDSAAQADTASLDPDQPRRRQEARKLTLLSLATSIPVYDFARDTALTTVLGRPTRIGFTTGTVTNTISSDLLRGLSLSVTHEIFRKDSVGQIVSRRDSTGAPLPGGTTVVRQNVWAPHIQALNASFSLSNNSGIFRLLGLGPKAPKPGEAPARQQQPTPADSAGASPGTARAGLGMIPNRDGRDAEYGARAGGGPVGSWNASLTYSLFRPRADELAGGAQESQMVTGNLSFQPTEHWSVQWNTGYNFTLGQFSDHMLTLTRDLHDWEAHFSFVKAQNGNFTFMFNVNLRANPDLKFDYAQRGRNDLNNPF